MVATLNSTRNPYLNPAHYQDRQRNLFILNGLNRMQRWDGKTSATEDAGITAPTTAATIAGAGSGSLTGTYTAYVRYLDDEGIPSALSLVSNEIAITSKATVDYSSVPVSPEARVTQRQLFRNTDGQETTYYLDATIANNSGTTASSSKTDAQLEASTELAIYTDEGDPNADRFGVPPSTRRVAVELHGRTLYGVSAVYDEGSAELTNSSVTVTIRGGTVSSDFVNRYLYVPGHSTAYLISAVSTTDNTLTLGTAYTGTTNLFSDYSVEEHTDDQNGWSYSYTGEPESVYDTNQFKVEHFEGDVDTAGFRLSGALFVAQRRNLWQVIFTEDPACDLDTRHAAHRGCVNPFTWVMADNVVFILDEKGVYAFDGQDVKPLSGPIQDLWRRDSRVRTHDYRLNWQTASRWHASHSPTEEVVRFHVNIGGGFSPREALCFHYRLGHWWIEAYHRGIGANCRAYIEGRAAPVFGMKNELLIQSGTMDRTIEDSGTTRGYVDSATLLTLTDNDASFPASYAVNSPVAIVGGKGYGQLRTVTAVSSGTLTVDHPWGIKPDTTSEYLVGAIPWRWRSPLFALPPLERDSLRRMILAVQPTPKRTTMQMRLFYGHEQRQATKNKVAFERLGAASFREDADVTWELHKNPSADDPDVGDWQGMRDWNVDFRIEDETIADRWLAVELAGFQGGSPLAIYSLTVEGAMSHGGRGG